MIGRRFTNFFNTSYMQDGVRTWFAGLSADGMCWAMRQIFTIDLSRAGGGLFTNTNPEVRRVVPEDVKGRTKLKVVYVVLEAQYQSALTAAVRNINATRDKVQPDSLPTFLLLETCLSVLCREARPVHAPRGAPFTGLAFGQAVPHHNATAQAASLTGSLL
jgi:hypothetical protein